VRAEGGPLLVFGIDGGDARMLLRWAAEGHLPVLAALLQRGGHATTSGPEHVCEHGTGLSLLSGQSRASHGHYNFRELRPGSYELRIATAKGRAEPFWARLRGTGQRVAVLDPFDTYPACGVAGVQVANLAIHEAALSALPAAAEPPGLLAEAERILGRRERFLEYDVAATPAADRALLRRMLDRIGRKGRLLRHLARGRPDLVVAGFYEAHTGGHRFWRYRPEARGPLARREDPELTHAIRSLCAAIDRELGLLLAELPPDANVFVVSAFGMEDHFPMGGLASSFCRELGYQPAPPPGPPTASPLDLARRLLPQGLRAWISERLPGPIQERLLADAFRSGTDWSRTTAFAIPSLYTSFLRVNLKGREPLGTVERGADYEALLKRLSGDLLALLDPATGACPVARITCTAEAFGGGPPEALPDVFVEWKPRTEYAYRLEHPRATLDQAREAYFRDSYHSYQGFVAAAGPALAGRGALPPVELLDLAPTFLHLLGQPPSKEWRGSVARSLLG
jgi:predicted AlkP superfamily phosphohydrolase/phosphomutase